MLEAVFKSPLAFNTYLPLDDLVARRKLSAVKAVGKKLIAMCELMVSGELDSTLKEIASNVKQGSSEAKFLYPALNKATCVSEFKVEMQ